MSKSGSDSRGGRKAFRSLDDVLREYLPKRWEEVRRSRMSPEERLDEDARRILSGVLNQLGRPSRGR